jgi:hypothetical protein
MTAPDRFMTSAEVDAPDIPISDPSGLLSLAARPAVTDERWVAGYRYTPTKPGHTVRNRSIYTMSVVGENLGAGAYPEEIETVPWILEAVAQTSTFNHLNRDLGYQRAEKLLEDTTSLLLERELWAGDIARADNLPNRYLTDESLREGDIIGGTGGINLRSAIGALVTAVKQAGMGTAMVHMPLELALTLPGEWNNAVLLEQYGFVVVSGAGYLYPETGAPIIYGTELCNVRLTDIEPLETSMIENVNRSNNELTFTARRIGAVDFAGPVFAAAVNVPTP